MTDPVTTIDPVQPGERYPIAFNFFGKTPQGVKPVSGTVTATEKPGDVDTPAFLQSSAVVVSGWNVLIGLQATTEMIGKKFLVQAAVTFTDGSILKPEVLVPVANPVVS